MKHVVLQDSGRSAVPEIVIVALSGVSLLTLGAVYEPFAFVCRAFPKVLARVVLAGHGWAAGTRDVGHMTGFPSSLSDLAKGLEDGPRPDTVILCGGPPGFGATDIALPRIVRAAGRRGIHLICVGGANFVAAQSGLLQGAAAIPWGMAEAFSEWHPDVEISDTLFIRRGRVDSCVGEAAALDMTLAFMAERFSPAIAHAARVHLSASAPRLGSEQRKRCPDHTMTA